ncbi:MAG: HIT family protein [Bacilli bacterium]
MDIFCKIINGEIPSYTIYEDDVVKAFLDVNPNHTGHTLIVPKKHYQDFFDLDEATLNHILKVAKSLANLLKEKLNYDGISLCQNNGLGQEVKHFHLHLIPKYHDEKKLSLEEVYEKLK